MEYMRQWMALPRVPTSAPRPAAILLHRHGRDSGSVGHVFHEALRAEPVEDARHVLVKRRQGAASQRHANVSLPAYVAFRVSQGVTSRDAVQEWNGGQILQHG